jgi:hypothetical protein
MKRNLLIATATTLLAASLTAADSSPRDEVLGAAKKLAEKENYSWRTTVVVAEDAPFKPGPTEGKTEKEGYTSQSFSFGENTTKAVLKGGKGTATGQDGDWQTLAQMEDSEGPMRFLAMRLRTFKSPAEQVAEVAQGIATLKKEGEIYSGDLSEEGAKKLLSFRPSQGDGPSISNAKGSAKFWVKDGVLTKYELKVKGSMSFNGNDVDMDRTSTVEIKDVGTTKVNVPDEAKKKLS